ncbi:MAG: beta-lactamase family protein [Verrucomicrobiales bacterium]|nr:beta-lactamase family protein [Verrucomicrobiales bacterium]
MKQLEEIFRRNFEERAEVGASVSVWKDGQEILTLHYGWRDRDESAPWNGDTLCPVWSVTKGPAAIATLHAIIEAGISPSARVSEIWPELRAASKSRLTFSKLLAHGAGLAALDSDNRPDILNHRAVVAALEKQEPNWTPGKAHGYHPRTYGFLLDEIVRRVSNGKTLGSYWKEMIATPAKIDFHIGNLTNAELSRLAAIIPPKIQRPNPEELPFYRAIADPESIAASAFGSPGGMSALSDINKLEYLQAGLPALGGVGSANGIARFYQILAQSGELDGVRYLPRPVTDAARSQQFTGDDQTFLFPTTFATGFMKDPIGTNGTKSRTLFGPTLQSFGQPGAGGSHAFADPESGISFAYVMNQMETGVLPNRKSLDLVEALYAEL